MRRKLPPTLKFLHRKSAQKIAPKSIHPQVCDTGGVMEIGSSWSKTWTYYQGKWQDGNIGIMGPRTHAAWLCSVVFDGARAFEGVTPDLELHCTRVNDSAKKLFLKPTVSTETW